MKVALITGTTSGIGLQTAHSLLGWADRVLCLNRSECDIPGVENVHCDLASFRSVREAATLVSSLLGGEALSLLCCNAACFMCEDVRTGDGYDVQMQTNHLSHTLLVDLLLPHLENGKVVSVSSVARCIPYTRLEEKYLLRSEAGTLGGNGMVARAQRYHMSKLASACLVAQRQGTGNVEYAIVDPGIAYTNLLRDASGAQRMAWKAFFYLFATSASDAAKLVFEACSQGGSLGSLGRGILDRISDPLIRQGQSLSSERVAEIPLGMDEPLVQVDDADNVVGCVSKYDAHRVPNAVLHRAFSLLLFSEDGDKMLIQQRSEHKSLFPLIWANACCSHPHYRPSEMDAEWGVHRAAQRKVKQEIGVEMEYTQMYKVARIRYRAACDIPEWEEWELDHILFATLHSSQTVDPNPEEVKQVRWVTLHELGELRTTGAVSPWLCAMCDNGLSEWWQAHVAGHREGILSEQEENIVVVADASG